MARVDNTGRSLALVAGGGALVWLILRGGDGFGLGGKSEGSGHDAGTRASAPVVPLQIRVDASGIAVDGQPANIGQATELTKARGAAELIVTGSAAYGIARALIAALRTTGAAISVKGAV